MDVSVVLLVALAAVAALRRRSAALRHWILTAAVACALATPAARAQDCRHGACRPERRSGRRPSSRRGRLPCSSRSSRTGRLPHLPRSRHAARAPGPTSSPGRPARPVGHRRIAALLILRCGWRDLKRLSRRVARVDDPRWPSAAPHDARAFTASAGAMRAPAQPQSRHGRHLGAVPAAQCSCPRMPAAGAMRGSAWSSRTSSPTCAATTGDPARGRRAEILYWFHPLAWMAARALRREAERACDDLVLNAGVAGPEYAGHLLAVARAASSLRAEPAAAAMARPSTLEGRIRAMLNVRLNQRPAHPPRPDRRAACRRRSSRSPQPPCRPAPRRNPASARSPASIYDPAGGVLPSAWR